MLSLLLFDLILTIFDDIFILKLLLLGKKEELIDKIKENNLELEKIQNAIKFFEETVNELRNNNNNLPECPICLDKMVWGSCVVTTCGCFCCFFLIRNN